MNRQADRRTTRETHSQAVEQIWQAGSPTGEQTRRLPYENRDMKADRHTGRAEVQSGRHTDWTVVT